MSQHDAWVMVIALLYTLLSIGIPIFLYYKKIISSFQTRKIIHAFAGLVIFSLLFLDSPVWAFLFAATVTLFVFMSTEKSTLTLSRYLFDSIHEEEERIIGYLQGPLGYCLATSLLCLLAVFFPTYNYLFIIAMLTMMYADTYAAIVGKKIGTKKLFGTKRTKEGSLTFFAITFVISFVILYFFGRNVSSLGTIPTLGETILLSFGGAIGGTVIELFSPSKWDDLLIPLGMVGVLGLINILF